MNTYPEMMAKVARDIETRAHRIREHTTEPDYVWQDLLMMRRSVDNMLNMCWHANNDEWARKLTHERAVATDLTHRLVKAEQAEDDDKR